MTTRPRPAPCGGPFLYAADNLSLYHAHEKPSDGQEHSHDDLQIAIPLSGPVQAHWQDSLGAHAQQQVSPGSLLVHSSRQPHHTRIREETELAVVWLPAPFIAQIACELTGHDSVEFDSDHSVDDSLLHHLCLSLLSEVRQGQPPARLYVDSVANLMAVHLIRHHSTGKRVTPEKGGLSPRTLRRVLDYIRQHLDQDVSLATLAGIAHLSESRFNPLFRQSTGMSPYQYVLAQRIERAKSLLCAERLSVGEVALQVGFCDQSQFTRQFKKQVGLTPKVFARDFPR